ncbi:MAG: TonB-dependent receptor [Immundisolibacterales bacterium]|nr:TonB-dependent receptor [Immundisolibacterales bacterium]
MKIFLMLVALLGALAAGAAHAGPLAPAPRVFATYDRNFIARSGAQSLEELLDTGIVRYFLTGGQPLLVLVNGRPYATTSSDLDTLPLSAIERIELLSGDTLGTLDGNAVRGALNVVLRNDLDGFEAHTVARMPTRDGGDGRQASVFWGGAIGDGRITLGVDVLRREEIAARSREYSRSTWTPGGAFSDAANVSVGGNTVWIVQRDEDKTLTGVRSIALGECDPARGYTGPLSNPPGITSGDDKGCGFAYGAIMWNTSSYEQKSAILNLEHPIGEKADLHLDANFTRGDSAFRYAPSVGTFIFTPNPGLLDAIDDAAGSDFVADENDLFVVGHRFVGHGNRDWLTDTEEYDVSASLEGRLTEGLGYDARVSAFYLDGFLDGNTFVHADRITSEIQAGSYDLEDPFSDAEAHLRAIDYSSLRLENDFGGDYLGARLALEGTGFEIGGRASAWTAGVEWEDAEVHDVTVYRANDGMTYDVSEVLGSGGTSYAGERRSVAGFAEMSLPLTENLDLRVAGRGDEADDVGRMESWRLGAEYRATNVITLRGSWSAGETPPSMSYLHSSEVQDHPYIDCDPGSGSPPRSCTELNPRQVTRVTTGNPGLDPSDTVRLAFGGEAREGPFFAGVELYRLSRSGLPGQNTANWAMQNLNECKDGETMNCIERTGGDITIHDEYANVVDAGISGISTRFGGGFRTGFGVVGMRGVWRRITGTDLRVAGEEDHYPIPKNFLRAGFLARRGNLSAIWTINYRSGFENREESGTFDSWTGHDLVLDWTEPLGLEGARVAAGVFNITDAGLTVDTANPNSVDGPTVAGWGRTLFVTLNMQF